VSPDTPSARTASAYRITQHYAIDNYDDLPRRLNRVTVAGDIPVGTDGRPSYSVTGDASHYTPAYRRVRP
jgi:alpha-ketoglutarate-dependent sulfate ester dioxygenase